MNPILPPPGGNPCDTPIIGDIACSPIVRGPGGWFETAIVAAAEAVFGFAISMLSWIWGLINDVTRPRTDASFIYEWASRVFAISLPIIVAFLVFQVSMTVLRNRSAEGLGKAVAMAGVAVLGTSVSVPVVHLLTSAVDALADDLTAVTFGDLDNLGDRFTEAAGIAAASADTVLSADQIADLGAGSAVAGAFGFIVFGVFLVLGSIAVFGALLIRAVLLYVTVVMGPLAIMGLAWEKSRSWFKIWAGVTVTLIVSKLAIMIVFGLGVTVLESLSFGDGGAGIAGGLLTGTLMLLLASLMPVACFKFFNFVGDEVQAGAMHGDAKAGAQRAGEMAQRSGPSQIMKSLKNGDSGKGSPSGRGSQGTGDGPGRSAPSSQASSNAAPGKGNPGETRSTSGPSSTSAPASGQDSGATGTTAGSGSGPMPASSGASSGASGAATAGAVVGAAVGATVTAGNHAAQSAAEQADGTAGGDRTGPDITRPNE